jgi:hypothetical protein
MHCELLAIEQVRPDAQLAMGVQAAHASAGPVSSR